MAWPEDLDEQMRRRWLSRLAQERLDLSASVEATLGATPLQEGQFPDTLGTTPDSVQAPQKKVIIPPRLSLQSRLMPAVAPNARALSLGVKQSFIGSDTRDGDLPVARVEPVTEEQNANLLIRLAHRITSSLSSLLVNSQDEQRVTVGTQDVVPLPLLDEPHNEPGVYESSLALPAPRSTQMESPGQVKQRVPKRPARVRLEAASTQGTLAREGMPAQMEGQNSVVMGSMQSGSGIFESGRSEVAIANTGVKSSSVVVVMLAGDPGPVVVQYITLRPQNGFTVHLSAPALGKTSFNYVVLAGE